MSNFYCPTPYDKVTPKQYTSVYSQRKGKRAAENEITATIHYFIKINGVKYCEQLMPYEFHFCLIYSYTIICNPAKQFTS